MSRQVSWNKIVLEEFIRIGSLTEEEERTIRLHVAGWSRVKISDTLGVSVPTVDRIIRRLKEKYDNCQRYSPILSPRKGSNVIIKGGQHDS